MEISEWSGHFCTLCGTVVGDNGRCLHWDWDREIPVRDRPVAVYTATLPAQAHVHVRLQSPVLATATAAVMEVAEDPQLCRLCGERYDMSDPGCNCRRLPPGPTPKLSKWLTLQSDQWPGKVDFSQMRFLTNSELDQLAAMASIH